MTAKSIMERVLAPRQQRPQRPARCHPLNLAHIRPVIRIAHRVRSPLRILQRQIRDHELVLFLAGSGQVLINGHRHDVQPHTLFYLQPFTTHSLTCPGDCEHIAVHFDWTPQGPASLPGLEKRTPYRMKLPSGIHIATATQLSRGHRIESLLIDILRLRAQGQAWSNLEASNRLTDALVELMRLRKDRATPASHRASPQISSALNHKKLLRAIHLMQEQLTQPLKISDLSAIAGLSPAHFRRLFHQWTGYAPLEYLRRLRMEKARKLLCDVDLSVKQIALQVGFDDPYHFSRSFRQLDGRSPTEFRNAALSDELR